MHDQDPTKNNNETEKDIEEGFDVDPDLNSEESRQVADLIALLGDKSYKGFSELDTEDHQIHPALVSAYTQHAAIGFVLVQFQEGNLKTGNVQTVYDELADKKIVNFTLRSVNEMHTMIDGMSKHAGVSRQEFTSHPDEWDIEELAVALGNDYFTYCKMGLIGSDGDSSNLQYAAQRLRALNMVMLFSDSIYDEDVPEKYADSLKSMLKDVDPAVLAKAEQLAMLYAGTGFSSSELKRFRRVNEDSLNEIVNYAAQIMLAGVTAGQLAEDFDIEASREKYREILKSVGESDLESISAKAVKILHKLEKDKSAKEDIVQNIEQAMDLQWEVLPPGELENIAREIVGANQTETKKPQIDLERLLILERIRKEWGAENTYYARGVLGKRKVIKSDGKEQPDQYLVLVLQEKDKNGAVIAEHAIAESPITQVNALYVHRQDVSEGLTWQEVMALPKSYAKALGARPVVHSMPRHAVPEGYLVTSMAEKVKTLLTATKEEFPLIEFSGERGHRIRIPKSVIPDPKDDHQ